MTSPPLPTKNSWIESLRRWARMAGAPMVVSVLMSLCTFLGLSLLYRGLPPNEAGTLALLLSLSDILVLVSLLGLGTTITRLYAASPPGVFDWPIDLLRTAAYSLPFIGLGSAVLYLLYDLPPVIGLYLLVLTALGSLLAAAYSMINSRGHYAWSAFLIRVPNASLLLPGLLTLVGAYPLRLPPVLLIFLLASILAAAAALLLLTRVLPRGRQTITRKQRVDGLAFMVTTATDLLPEQGLIAVAGRILPLSQVAAFAAMAVLLRPFRLLRSVLAMILAPDLVRYRRASYRKLFVSGWTLAILCGVGAAALIPPLAARFYGARYQDAQALIPYLCLAGAILLGTIPPRVDLTVRGSIRTVNRFALVYFGSMLAGVALCIAGMNAIGPFFLGPAVVLLQSTECGVAYTFWFGFRRSEAVG